MKLNDSNILFITYGTKAILKKKLGDGNIN